jgi:hypothetical protein
MKKLSAISLPALLAAGILAAAGCGHPTGDEASKPAANASAPQTSSSKTNPAMGSIKVASKPAGATILLIAAEGADAGKPQTRGSAPSTVTDITPGKYTLFLELKGYKPFEKAVEVKAGETVPIVAELKK